MAKGEIVIDESICKGCGYCSEFCARGCIEVPGDRVTHKGYSLPVFAVPEKCNACGICAWMSLLRGHVRNRLSTCTDCRFPV